LKRVFYTKHRKQILLDAGDPRVGAGDVALLIVCIDRLRGSTTRAQEKECMSSDSDVEVVASPYGPPRGWVCPDTISLAAFRRVEIRGSALVVGSQRARLFGDGGVASTTLPF
jgi:hypothetical protein